jgi:hypothetical protein
MSEKSHPTAGSESGSERLKRRGLLAAVAALATGLLAKLTAQPAAAVDGSALIVGQNNTSTNITVLSRTNAGAFNDALLVTNTNGPGIEGRSNNSFGVWGAASSASSYGVRGEATSAVGVYGTSVSNIGVYGLSDQSIGLRGESNTGVGVFSSSVNNYAFFGTSTSGVGMEVTGGTFGIIARATAGNGTAIFAISNSGPAAQFFGPVTVTGSLTATGIKSAVVPHPDGSHRRMYCEEATESWFSDYGEDRVVNGRARVRLDRDFNAVVHGDNYHVYLTPKGDCNGLYVSSQGPDSFEVRELRAGTSTVSFDYRVVAKRRDVPSPRLERVNLPRPPRVVPRGTQRSQNPDDPQIPEPPQIPERPQTPSPPR